MIFNRGRNRSVMAPEVSDDSEDKGRERAGECVIGRGGMKLIISAIKSQG